VGQIMDHYPKINSSRPLFKGPSARIPYTIRHYSSLFSPLYAKAVAGFPQQY
jgi:hypothetical protein